MGKKNLWFVSALAAGGVLAAANYMLDTALKRRPSGDLNLPDDDASRELNSWFNAGARRVARRTLDKKCLNAWFIPNDESHRYAIVCHGYGGCGRAMRHRAKPFFDMGFNILLPDARAHGGSSGEMVGMGWPERRDIVDWIYEILKRDAEAEIILFGESMGAATVMMTAGEVLPSNVKLVIEDCGYTDVMEEMNFMIRHQYKVPSFPIVPVASLLSHFRAGYTFTRASAVEQIRRCKIPVLFMHAEQDTVVPYPMVFSLFAAARCEKELVTFPGAGHVRCAETDPDLYWGSIRKFIEKYM